MQIRGANVQTKIPEAFKEEILSFMEMRKQIKEVLNSLMLQLRSLTKSHSRKSTATTESKCSKSTFW